MLIDQIKNIHYTHFLESNNSEFSFICVDIDG